MKKHHVNRHALVVWPLVSIILIGAAATGRAQDKPVDPATKQLMAATGLFKDALYEQAAAKYRGFLEDYPTHAEAVTARYGLAICFYRLDKYAEAAVELQEVVKDAKFKQRDEALAVQGHCLLVTKEYEKALTAFEDLRKNHEKSKHMEVAELNRAQVLYHLTRYGDSLKACQDFIDGYGPGKNRGTARYFLACSQHALGDHPKAEETLRKFLDENKDSPQRLDATLLLGQSLENQGKFPAAVEQYKDFIEAAPAKRRGEGYYSLGLVHYNARKYGESIEALKIVDSDYGDSEYAPAARLQLGLAQLADAQLAESNAADAELVRAKFDAARKTLEQSKNKDPESRQKAGYWLAQCDMAQKDFKSARAALDGLAKAKPAPENLDAVLHDRAVCAMELGTREPDAAKRKNLFSAAEKEFNDYVGRCKAKRKEGDPPSEQEIDGVYRRAFCLHNLGKYGESESLCDGVLKAKNAAAGIVAATEELSAENLFLTAQQQEDPNQRRKDLAEAAGKFEKLRAAARAGQDEDRLRRFTFRQGQCAFLQGGYAKAVGLLKPVADDPAAAKDERLREAAFFLGDALLQLGRNDQAAAALGGYLNAGGKRRQEAQFKLGLAQLRDDQTTAAESTFAPMIEPASDSIWAMRAMLAYGQMAYHKLGDPKKAADELLKLEKLLVEKGDKAPAELAAPTIYLLAWIDFDAKKYEQSAGRFDELVKRFGGHTLAADAALQRAICASKMGDPDKAVDLLKDFEKTYKGSDRVDEAEHLRGTWLAGLNRHEDAIADLSKLAADDRTCTERVLYELAWSQRKNGQNADAMKTYRKLLDKFPAGELAAPARTELAQLLYGEKQNKEATRKEAAALFEAVLKQAKAPAGPKVEAKTLAVARYLLGWCYAELSEPDKAAAAFSDFVREHADNELVPSALCMAGECYMKAGIIAESEASFVRLLDKFGDHEVATRAHLKLGEVQATAEEYEKSAATYKGFLEKHGEDSKYAYTAKFGIGWALQNQGNYNDARTWYTKVTNTHNGKTAARAQFQIGECYLAEKDLNSAAAAFLEVEYVYNYPEWAAVALYQAGSTFEGLAKQDPAKLDRAKLDRAKGLYKSCIDKYGKQEPETAALANERLNKLPQ